MAASVLPLPGSLTDDLPAACHIARESLGRITLSPDEKVIGALFYFSNVGYTNTIMIQLFFVFSGVAIAVLRIILGSILLAHGVQKIRGWNGAAQSFEKMGFKPGTFWLGVATAVEVVGGTFLILGLLTQAVALLVALQFAIIILKLKWRQGLVDGYEFDLLILGAALVLATVGGGTYDLDSFLGILVY